MNICNNNNYFIFLFQNVFMINLKSLSCAIFDNTNIECCINAEQGTGKKEITY